MTGYAETDTVIQSHQSRAVCFGLSANRGKPSELMQIVHDAMDHYRLVSEHRELTRLTAEQNRELLELNQDLEKRVQDRTRQLRENEEQLKKTLTQAAHISGGHHSGSGLDRGSQRSLYGGASASGRRFVEGHCAEDGSFLRIRWMGFAWRVQFMI
jgi:hypothetical protein